MTEEEESEANLFASYLLVPPSLLAKEVKKLGGSVDLVDGKTIEGLAEKFQVSIPYELHRLTKTHGCEVPGLDT
jgi:Zn-dependent peptidase ImmA (M78 family)